MSCYALNVKEYLLSKERISTASTNRQLSDFLTKSKPLHHLTSHPRDLHEIVWSSSSNVLSPIYQLLCKPAQQKQFLSLHIIVSKPLRGSPPVPFTITKTDYQMTAWWICHTQDSGNWQWNQQWIVQAWKSNSSGLGQVHMIPPTKSNCHLIFQVTSAVESWLESLLTGGKEGQPSSSPTRHNRDLCYWIILRHQSTDKSMASLCRKPKSLE